MRSTRNLIRIASVSALLVAGVFGSKSARAEADTFGIGSGRTGAVSITTSTVVNSYASITANVTATATTITVDSASGFAAGDLILIWQTTGLAVALTTDLSTVSTGSFEYARIKSVAGNVVTLTNPIVSATGFAANTAQIVRVPEYTTLAISAAGSINAAPWDGTKGGIVVVFANGAVTNDGVISSAQSGLRGGILVNDPEVFGCLGTDVPVTPGLAVTGVAGATFNALAGGAKKGEGLFTADYSTDTSTSEAGNLATFGRGNVSTGAGGGDCSNSGGAGGGHGGVGGQGGNTWAGETDIAGITTGNRPVGGEGGAAITYSPLSRLSMGGGGGAGEENDSAGTAGGIGGGAVLLRVSSLAGTGTISGDGQTAANSANDGAGGGGAGGLIVVLSATSATCGGLHAIGGTGGNCAADHGPGGGGSGGVILIQSASGTCGGTVTGGPNGTDANVLARNAMAGGDGASSTINTGFTGTCDVTLGTCGGCVVDSDCIGGTICDTAINLCVSIGDGGLILPDGGITGLPDGGLLLPDGGIFDPDAGSSSDGGLLSDGGSSDGGSGTDGGSGNDGGSGSDGGFFDGGSFDGGSFDGGGFDGGNVTGDGGGNQTGGSDDNGELEGGGCSTTGASSDGEGAAFLGLGLVAALAFMRRKRR